MGSSNTQNSGFAVLRTMPSGHHVTSKCLLLVTMVRRPAYVFRRKAIDSPDLSCCRRSSIAFVRLHICIAHGQRTSCAASFSLQDQPPIG